MIDKWATGLSPTNTYRLGKWQGGENWECETEVLEDTWNDEEIDKIEGKPWDPRMTLTRRNDSQCCVCPVGDVSGALHSNTYRLGAACVRMKIAPCWVLLRCFSPSCWVALFFPLLLVGGVPLPLFCGWWCCPPTTKNLITLPKQLHSTNTHTRHNTPSKNTSHKHHCTHL